MPASRQSGAPQGTIHRRGGLHMCHRQIWQHKFTWLVLAVPQCVHGQSLGFGFLTFPAYPTIAFQLSPSFVYTMSHADAAAVNKMVVLGQVSHVEKLMKAGADPDGCVKGVPHLVAAASAGTNGRELCWARVHYRSNIRRTTTTVCYTRHHTATAGV